MVHRRELDGREIVLGNQGDLYRNAMTWWDHETGSIWSQPLGEAIVGPLRGARLELLPSTLTTWSSWLQEHPDTLALATGAGRAGFRLDDMLIAVVVGDEAVAVPVRRLRAEKAVAAVVGGRATVVVISGDVWSVFLSGGGLEVTGGGSIGDAAGNRWDPASGRPLAGDARPLIRVPAFTVFEADFRVFWPDGKVLSG